MARKSDPIEKARIQQERELCENNARNQESQELKSKLWPIWTLFEAIVICDPFYVEKTLGRKLREGETVEVLLEKMAELLLELRQLLAQFGWRKRLHDFVTKTEAEEFAIELLTGKSTRIQIISRLKNAEELPNSGMFRSQFNSALKQIQCWLPDTAETKAIWNVWIKREHGNVGYIYDHIVDKAKAQYLKHKKSWTNMDRDLEWLKLRISGQTVNEISKDPKWEHETVRKGIEKVRKAIHKAIKRLELDRATLGLSSRD